MRFLETERLVLRPLNDGDLNGASPYLGWLNDPEVCRYNSHHTWPYTREAARAWLASASRSELTLAVCLKDFTHIGNISLQKVHPVNRSAEFAILLGAKDAWGQGYGREAGLALCRHGFDSLNLHRIYCGTHDENIGMQKLALGLGMREEGRLSRAIYKNGEYADVIRYGVLKKEFYAHCHHIDRRAAGAASDSGGGEGPPAGG